MASGADGIRLQDVAREVGVSHPTVLHHFGSREALVEAVANRTLDSLHDGVVAALTRLPGGEDQVAALLDGVYEALVARGQGRALMWLALASPDGPRDDLRLRQQAEVLQMARRARFPEREPSPLEDSQFLVVLAASALLTQSVLGAHLLRGAGVTGARAPGRYRAWLARLLLDHVERGG